MKAVFFDLDGTVYYGNKIIDGANEVIQAIREKGISIYFLTNNSTKTRDDIYKKLLNIGVDCAFEEVVTSGYIAGLYSIKNNIKDMFVFGSEGLKKELTDMGITIMDDERAQNLLIGYNPQFTYNELTIALRVALSAKHIIACNKERYFPGNDAKLFPGCGAMVAPIEWCANREVDYVIGKPNTFMIEVVCDKYGYPINDVLMIGDTYESDILMAKRAGCKSVYIGPDKYHDTVCVDNIRKIIEIL